jgi:hypothetical protein
VGIMKDEIFSIAGQQNMGEAVETKSGYSSASTTARKISAVFGRPRITRRMKEPLLLCLDEGCI